MTHITLIPKKDGACEPSDFCPICLTNNYYKILKCSLTASLR